MTTFTHGLSPGLASVPGALSSLPSSTLLASLLPPPLGLMLDARPDLAGAPIVDGWSGLVPLVDLNPLHWLGDAAKEGVADGFTAMMMSLWSAALWLLRVVFKLLDRFSIPYLHDPGLTHLYAVTLWISLVVALIVGLGQIGLAAIRRDGRSLGSLTVGIAQYGAVVTAWVGVCGALILACGGLTAALLQELVGVDGFTGYPAGAGWVDQVSGTVEAAVLGVCALFLLIPAAFGYLLIMLVREAALLILVATMPIAAAGALGESTRAWMWKSVRWFLAACLTSPLLALILGLGVQIARSAFPDDGSHTPGSVAAPGGDLLGVHTVGGAMVASADAAVTDTAANIGMAVVGCVLMLVGCFCPMALFRLLAFVDPGTGSGASFRSTLSANGGVAGLLSGRPGIRGGSGAAIQTGPDGRSTSESSADAETANRYQARTVRALGAAGRLSAATMSGIGRVAQQGAAMSVDVMGQSGVGHQGYYDTAPRPARPGTSRRGSGQQHHLSMPHPGTRSNSGARSGAGNDEFAASGNASPPSHHGGDMSGEMSGDVYGSGPHPAFGSPDQHQGHDPVSGSPHQPSPAAAPGLNPVQAKAATPATPQATAQATAQTAAEEGVFLA